ncbi:MAG: hypothetical protein PUG48_04585 [Clostridia bacterium]|nr:hypothetical protein [Clostridia bacterium]
MKFLKKFLNFLKWLIICVGGFFLFAAGCAAVILIIVGIVNVFKTMGNTLPIIVNIIFAIICAVQSLGCFGMFCGSFAVMVSPKKYKSVDVEIIDVDVSDGVDYGPYYWPVVKRTDDTSNPPHKIIPKYESYNTREEVEALFGTHITLYATDNKPYELFYKKQLSRKSSVLWTLSLLGFTILGVLGFLMFFEPLKDLWSGEYDFWEYFGKD